MGCYKTPLTFGFPRMHKEAGERRDFLPPLVKRMAELGAQVAIEEGLGSGMGISQDAYLCEGVRVVSNAEALLQDMVLILRCPEVEQMDVLRPSSTLISMIHLPTRPRRVKKLLELGGSAISLDSIAGDDGRRLVENMHAVAWNGVEAAFDLLEQLAPQRLEAGQRPIRAAVMGVGMVGKHAVEAATKYGNLERSRKLRARGLAGVEVTVLGRELTSSPAYLKERLALTEVLVDATQRADPSTPLIPNEAIAVMPAHAVICDLVVDPYVPTGVPPTVRSIEGIPRGDLDQYRFLPHDPAWTKTIPESVPTRHRRATASCYSWPGVHPEACMAHYGEQLLPLLEVLLHKGEANLSPEGGVFERALYRGSLRGFLRGGGA